VIIARTITTGEVSTVGAKQLMLYFIEIFDLFLLGTLLGGINFLMDCGRREDAIRLYCFGCSPDGGGADIQVPEPDLRDNFIVGHERDPAVIHSRDSRLYTGDGDWERSVWPASELDSRRQTGTALIRPAVVAVALCNNRRNCSQAAIELKTHRGDALRLRSGQAPDSEKETLK
jgi:hypothetical protein